MEQIQMERNVSRVQEVDSCNPVLVELNELQLAMIGGGIGETVL